ncbi:MAG: DUF3256 family protein [Bacteroidales bacterium]|nr:DUF3256 family protein [Bacteroidales bacterium]
MKLKSIIFAFALLLAATAAKADGVRQFFISEPGKVFELLPQGTRAAMITMAEQGQKILSNNVHGGQAQIDSLSENYISVRCSDVKQVELKLLTKGTRDTVIAVVETVNLPALDSRISFYSTEWHLIPLHRCMKGGEVKMSHFLRQGTPKDKAEEAMRLISFPLMHMTFGEHDGQLVVKHQLKDFLSRETYQRIRPYLIDSITYNIDGTKLKRSKR